MRKGDFLKKMNDTNASPSLKQYCVVLRTIFKNVATNHNLFGIRFRCQNACS